MVLIEVYSILYVKRYILGKKSPCTGRSLYLNKSFDA